MIEKRVDSLRYWGRVVRHPEVPAQFLDGRHSGRDGHFSRYDSECVMQDPPGAPRPLGKGSEVGLRDLAKEPYRENSPGEHVVHDCLRLGIRHLLCLKDVNLPRQASEVLLKSQYGVRELGSEDETGRMLPVQRNRSPRNTKLSQTNTESPAQSWIDMVLLFEVRRPRAATPSSVAA